MPPPLQPRCLINYTNRPTPPIYPKGPPYPIRGDVMCTLLNFFFKMKNKNLHLPHQGSNPCFLLSHHAALSTTPIGPPLPLTPRGRGHMYIKQFLFFHPNKIYTSHTRDRTRASSSPTMLPYQLHQSALPSPLPQAGEVICTLLNFFVFILTYLHLPYLGSNPCLFCSHHVALATAPIGPPLPLTTRGRGHTYSISLFVS